MCAAIDGMHGLPPAELARILRSKVGVCLLQASCSVSHRVDRERLFHRSLRNNWMKAWARLYYSLPESPREAGQCQRVSLPSPLSNTSAHTKDLIWWCF